MTTYITKNCHDCGNDYQGYKSAIRQTLCPDCQVSKNYASNRARNGSNSIEDLSHKTRGDYCAILRTCKLYPACLDCGMFYPIFENVDPGRMELWRV